MAVYDLDGLVSALLGAVHRAQQAAQDQHVDLANRYFVEKDGQLEPKSVKVSLPSLARPGETDSIDVPLITLVPISSMMIKEVEFDFETLIAEVAGDEPHDKALRDAAPVDLPGKRGEKMKVKIGLGGGWNVSRRNVMKVKVKVEAADPPEGLMRVNDRIVKQLP